MGEVIPLNHYFNSKHYLACGVSYAGHLANICQSNHKKILTAKILILFVETYPCLRPLHVKKTNNCLNALNLPCTMPKKS